MPRGGHLTVMFTLATLLLSCHTCQGAIKSNSSSVFAALKELLLLLWKCNWLLLKWKWYANKDIRHKRNIKGKSFVLSASGFIACPLVLESFNYLHHLYAHTGRIKWRRDKSYCTVSKKGVRIFEFLQKLLDSRSTANNGGSLRLLLQKYRLSHFAANSAHCEVVKYPEWKSLFN